MADGGAAHGVVPIENRLEGGVSATLDALADDVDLLIEAEVDVEVELVLAGARGIAPDAVTEVWSHPVALASCRRWLSDRAARRRAASRCPPRPAPPRTWLTAGVPTSPRSPTRWRWSTTGWATLATDIADTEGNHTRFVQVGLDIPARTGWDKTSLVVYIPDNHPGALFAMLEIFAERDLDLTKIESRPTKHDLGDYRFFVDVVGHLADERIADALAAVKRTQRAVKLLGSYPGPVGHRPRPRRARCTADDEGFRAAACVGRRLAWTHRLTAPSLVNSRVRATVRSCSGDRDPGDVVISASPSRGRAGRRAPLTPVTKW